jgi:hypothetical protein
MKIRIRPSLTLLVGVLLSPAVAWAQQPGAPAPANFGVSKETVFWAAFCIMTAILGFAFVFTVVGLLRSQNWFLGDALSEEAGNQPDPLPPGVKPVMVASSSRLMALLGLLNILGVFLGFGYYFLYAAFAGTVNLTDMKSVIYYVFSGAVMFAPYLANQLQSAFSSFGGAVAVPQTLVQAIQPVVPAAPVLVRGNAVG